jgi:hypothetical protein
VSSIGCGRGILYEYSALLNTDIHHLTKGFQFKALCNENRDVHKWRIGRIWKDTAFLYGKILNPHSRGDMPVNENQKSPSKEILNERYDTLLYNVSNTSYETLQP